MKSLFSKKRRMRSVFLNTVTVAILSCLSPVAMSDGLVDAFTELNTPADIVDPNTPWVVIATPSLTSNTGSANNSDSIIGDWRTVSVDNLAQNAAGTDARLNISGGFLSFSNDAGVIGQATVQWDGDDSPVLNPEGLSMNLWELGDTFAYSVIAVDLGVQISIETYSSATAFTKTVIEVATASGDEAIPFTALENAALCGYNRDTDTIPGIDPRVVSVTCGTGDTIPVNLENFGALQFVVNVGDPIQDVDFTMGPIEIVGNGDGHGRISPTGTTCEDFVNERQFNGDGLAVNLASFDMTVNKGKIFNVSNPGAAFYFTRFTTSGNVTVNIVQESGGGTNYEMDLSTWQLFEVVDAGEELGCMLVEQDKFGKPYQTDESITLSSLPAGEYAMRIRMVPKSIEGEVDPEADLTNNFSTWIGGTEVDRDPDGVLLKRIEK